MPSPPLTDNNTIRKATIISYHSHVLCFHPFSFVWRIFFVSFVFSFTILICKSISFSIHFYKDFLNEVEIFPSEEYPIIRDK